MPDAGAPDAALATATVDAAPSAAAPAAPAAPTLILEAHGDLDGDTKPERIALTSDGTLTAGALTVHVEIDAASAAFADQNLLEAVSLGKGRRGVHVVMPTSEGEDPPNRHRVFLVGPTSLTPVFDQVIGTYGGPPVVFSAAGVGTYVEDGWSACERQKFPGAAKLETVSLALRGAKIVEIGRRASGSTQKCDELSACPYVYVQDGDTERFVGEILRDLRRVKSEAVQSLVLDGGVQHLRLAEEKPETTYIDDIYLEVDGERVPPIACTAIDPPAYCATDGRRFVLHQGESIELSFATDCADRSCETKLVARGYYVPHGTTR